MLNAVSHQVTLAGRAHSTYTCCLSGGELYEHLSDIG